MENWQSSFYKIRISLSEKITIEGNIDCSSYLVVAAHNNTGPLFLALLTSGKSSFSDGVKPLVIKNESNYITITPATKTTPLSLKNSKHNILEYNFIPLTIDLKDKLVLKKISN